MGWGHSLHLSYWSHPAREEHPHSMENAPQRHGTKIPENSHDQSMSCILYFFAKVEKTRSQANVLLVFSVVDVVCWLLA